MKNYTILIVIGVILVLGVGWYEFRGSPSASPTPSDIVTSASPSVSPSGSQMPLPSNVITSDWYKQFTKPATCALTGSVKFENQSTAIDSAKISYTGIDSVARQVFWTVTPKDAGVKVGPNIAASLPLPNGSNMVTVTLPEHPVAKSYTLTAVMTYGRLVNQGVVISNARCSGNIPVTLSY